MSAEYMPAEILEFFKALADSHRLKIIGLLTQESHTVEQLAALLNIGVSTTSHHLSRLARAGLVEAKVDGHYYIYSLKTETLQKLSETFLQRENLSKLSTDIDMERYDAKILNTFLSADGRLISFPAQLKKYQVILKHIVKEFEPGVRYSEKQVNEILSKYNEDTAQLRRDMIAYHYMAREGGGKDYWRLEE